MPEFGPENLPPAKQTFAQTAFWLWRLAALAGASALLMLCWPRLARRPRQAKALLMLVAIPELWLFAFQFQAKAFLKDFDIPEEFVKTALEEEAPARTIDTIHMPNLLAAHGVDAARGYVGLMSARTNHFLTAASSRPRFLSMVSAPVNVITPAMLWPNVRFVIANEKTPISESLGAPVAQSGNLAMIRLFPPFPRAYFAREILPVPNEETALSSLEKQLVDPLVTVMAEGLEEAPEPPEPEDWVAIAERSQRRIALEMEAAGPRLLTLLDSYSKGWRCVLDGAEELQIHPANVNFRAVAVPAGRHRVVFEYLPPLFAAGAIVSLLGLAAAFGAIAAGPLEAFRAGKGPRRKKD